MKKIISTLFIALNTFSCSSVDSSDVNTESLEANFLVKANKRSAEPLMPQSLKVEC